MYIQASTEQSTGKWGVEDGKHLQKCDTLSRYKRGQDSLFCLLSESFLSY